MGGDDLGQAGVSDAADDELAALRAENRRLGGDGYTMHSNPRLALAYFREDNELRRAARYGEPGWERRYLTAVARIAGWDMTTWANTLAEMEAAGEI